MASRSPSTKTSFQRKRFEELFRSHYRNVFAYAARRVGADAAHDVASETFLVVWRRLDAVPADDALPWLLAVARKTLGNHERSARRRASLLLRLGAIASTAANVTSSIGPDATVVDIFNRLPKKEREALALIAWEGLDPHQAATVCGCSAQAFRVRLHRARQRFYEELSRLPARTPGQKSRATRLNELPKESA